jgi:hypothetical protein
MNHDRSDPIMPQPLCPACGQPATQTTLRDLSDTEHQLTGCCADGHLWISKWFAAVNG